jgi:hydroxyacylglutathione hydrolase
MNGKADEAIDFVTGAPAAGSLDVAWIHGARRAKRSRDPLIQVHRYDEHTVILRQSKSVHYEAPFLFLLFGNDRALLLDTGATAQQEKFPVRRTVDGLISEWLSRHPREGYQLVVAHTHGHGDHVAGDAQFEGRPATAIVARDQEAVREFFGFTAGWPDQVVEFGLGGRVLEVIGSPGHQSAAVTVFDPWTGILFTGDTVLPARLYVSDYPAFTATLDRLVDFAATRAVTHVLGCHVEMSSRPGRDYPLGATYQPDERAPQLTVGQLTAARDAAKQVAGRKGVHVFDDFIIYNEPGRGVMIRMLARGLGYRLRGLVRR